MSTATRATGSGVGGLMSATLGQGADRPARPSPGGCAALATQAHGPAGGRAGPTGRSRPATRADTDPDRPVAGSSPLAAGRGSRSSRPAAPGGQPGRPGDGGSRHAPTRTPIAGSQTRRHPDASRPARTTPLLATPACPDSDVGAAPPGPAGRPPGTWCPRHAPTRTLLAGSLQPERRDRPARPVRHRCSRHPRVPTAMTEPRPRSRPADTCCPRRAQTDTHRRTGGRLGERGAAVRRGRAIKGRSPRPERRTAARERPPRTHRGPAPGVQGAGPPPPGTPPGRAPDRRPPRRARRRRAPRKGHQGTKSQARAAYGGAERQRPRTRRGPHRTCRGCRRAQTPGRAAAPHPACRGAGCAGPGGSLRRRRPCAAARRARSTPR